VVRVALPLEIVEGVVEGPDFRVEGRDSGLVDVDLNRQWLPIVLNLRLVVDMKLLLRFFRGLVQGASVHGSIMLESKGYRLLPPPTSSTFGRPVARTWLKVKVPGWIDREDRWRRVRLGDEK
jgi:hypothetical protein